MGTLFDWLNPKRKATCGACGCERLVDSFMRKNLSFRRRRDQETDEFDCGCQRGEDEF